MCERSGRSRTQFFRAGLDARSHHPTKRGYRSRVLLKWVSQTTFLTCVEEKTDENEGIWA